MPSNYVEYIEFVNKVGANKRQRGIRISDDLVVAYASPYSDDKNRFRIFSIVSGRPVVNLDFYDRKDAEKFAKILDKVYKDYWFLLSEYPKMSIPQVCMWSVPDGIRIWLSVDMLQNRTDELLTASNNSDTITLTDLSRAYEAAKYKVEDYMKFPQKG
jgi:hypothetical protein